MKKILIAVAISIVLIAGSALIIMYNMGDRLIEEAIISDMNSTNNIQVDDSSVSDTNSEKSVEKQSEFTATVTPSPEPTPEPSKNTKQITPQKVKKEDKKITTEKIAKIKNEVAPTDKISAAALIIKRLSPGDISKLQGFMADGLSAEEKEKAKAMAYSKFTAEEINEIKALYRKYMK